MYIFKNKETWHFEVEILEEIHFRVIALWGNWCEHEESQSIQTGIFLVLSQENKVGVHWKAKGVWNTWRKVFLFLSYGFILEVLLEFTVQEGREEVQGGKSYDKLCLSILLFLSSHLDWEFLEDHALYNYSHQSAYSVVDVLKVCVCVGC